MSEHLNAGDVTGPRWAGGTTNPDGAEKAWRDLHPNVARSPIFDKGFNAGRASRNAEVKALRGQLAAAEAVIEKVKAAVPISTATAYDILCAAPSSVLAAVKADVWDEGAEIMLRVVGIESVENALTNLAENGHPNPHRREQLLSGRP